MVFISFAQTKPAPDICYKDIVFMGAIALRYGMNRNQVGLVPCCGSGRRISRGAEQARVSQPAVSKQIKESRAP